MAKNSFVAEVTSKRGSNTLLCVTFILKTVKNPDIPPFYFIPFFLPTPFFMKNLTVPPFSYFSETSSPSNKAGGSHYDCPMMGEASLET